MTNASAGSCEGKLHLFTWLDYLVIVGASLGVSAVMFFSSFHGDDEVMTLRVAARVVDALKTGDFRLTAMLLGADYHPPLRNLLPLPSIALLGPTMFAVRLPSILAWSLSCVLAGTIAVRLTSSRLIGLISGILVALTGLFQLEAMAIGHGYLTCIGLLLCRQLLIDPPRALLEKEDERAFIKTSMILYAGFLCFTTFSLYVAAIYTFYLISAIRAPIDHRRRAISRLIWLALPFVLAYLAYYAVFIGVPLYMLKQGYVDAPFGQLHQNLLRSQTAHLNIQSLIDNIKTTNYYTFPVIGPLISAIGLIGMLRRSPALFASSFLYFIIISFYMSGNTGQHFLSLTVWCFPFAAAVILRSNETLAATAPRAVIGLVAAAIGAWTFWLHMWPYSDTSYPDDVAARSFGNPLWRNNAITPIEAVGARLGNTDGLVGSAAGSAWEFYYFPNLNWARHPTLTTGANGCIQSIRSQDGRLATTVIALNSQTMCSMEHVTRETIPGSAIVIFRITG
ncbi:membrane hypothetical protein [uncultured Alphaproteobacteria bacterium]|uniref:Glycosyltransferase RgtA/B/C/D-like domain-containing protein n=1 Tax=uncultured Alphaproteobacteria bacterium TaxID=91750 RepID=A0A212KD66_9PROT|nr:membrane hypothetical protein [uncultured Alphaproteobacteria bacterium]